MTFVLVPVKIFIPKSKSLSFAFPLLPEKFQIIAGIADVCLQEKLMSIVGKKRVKPEVVLLLPRSLLTFLINSKIFSNKSFSQN